jgi:transposase InsO family protein
MLETTAFRSARKVIVESFRPILHILHKPLHQITPDHVADVMLQTQGKIERFFQTFEQHYPRFNDLNRFREYYNNKPHRGLNYKTPVQVYLN